MWLSYILTGAGANLVSWLILPRNAVSVGASGAVFGLFAISVLVKVIFLHLFFLIVVVYVPHFNISVSVCRLMNIDSVLLLLIGKPV